MKTQIMVLIGLVLSTTASYSKTLTYACSYPYMPSSKPLSITINTKSQTPTLIGIVTPSDESLPKITLELAYDFHILRGVTLKTAMNKPALLVSSGKTTTAIYGDIGQTLAMAFSSGELLTEGGPWPGGNPVTSEFSVVCEPL